VLGWLDRRKRGKILKTVVVTRTGDRSVADQLAEMRIWLADRSITPRELVMLHILNFQVVFRAAFDTAEDADRFVQEFAVTPGLKPDRPTPPSKRGAPGGAESSSRAGTPLGGSVTASFSRGDKRGFADAFGGAVPVWAAWLAVSVLWIAGVFFFESLAGQLRRELAEVIPTALLPPILPVLTFGALSRVRSDRSRGGERRSPR